MKHIDDVQAAVTPTAFDREPTAAELDAIDREMPLITAEVELLDAQIMTIDRPVSDLDGRRIRRARNRVLTARRNLTNRTAGGVGGAA